MLDETVRAEAKRAGIDERWTDYLGVTREVSVETLRAVLEVLQPAPAAQASMAVTRCGAQVSLPLAAARAGERVQLRDEAGAVSEAVLQAAGEQCALDAPSTPGYYAVEMSDRELTLAVAPSSIAPADELARRPGWALAVQLYALRGEHTGGIGGYGELAGVTRAVAAAGAQGVAVSPVHAAFSADAGHFSPYSPSSRLLLNAMYIDIAGALPGLADAAQIAAWANEEGFGGELQRLEQQPVVAWERAWPLKLRLLRRLWQRFQKRASPAQRHVYGEFVQRGGQRLRDHARFEMLHALQFEADPERWHWQRWPAPLRDVNSREVEVLAARHADEVDFHTFLQWLAANGLEQAQRAATDAGMSIGLIADLAVGSSSGGSQAWASPTELMSGLSLGAPPDLFNRVGQRWGVTTFSPQSLQRLGYAPFLDMVRAALRHAGGLRIDHILGLQRLWVVPEGGQSHQGAYLRYPIEPLRDLLVLEAWRHRALIIGEDLGTVPEGFREPLQQRGILGMQVLWFERDHGLFVHPSRWSSRSVAMTSTHDLPTVAGWWLHRDLDWREHVGGLPADNTADTAAAERDEERHALWNAFVHAGTASGEPPQEAAPAVDAALEFIAQTPAPLAMVPVEDLLGLEQQANLPGTLDEHPNWRRRLPAPFEALAERPEVVQRLSQLRRLRPP